MSRMSRKLRQGRSPVMLSAVFLAGVLIEGAQLSGLHTRVATALQDDVPLQTIHFVSAQPGDDMKLVRAKKCAHRGET